MAAHDVVPDPHQRSFSANQPTILKSSVSTNHHHSKVSPALNIFANDHTSLELGFDSASDPDTGALDTRNPSPRLLLICPGSNGTIYNSGSNKYQVICDIDIPGQNIMPFILTSSYEDCVAHCDEQNAQYPELPCAGALFAPGREGCADDCYLKSSLGNPASATLSLVGAILLPRATSITRPSTATTSAPTAAVPSKVASSRSIHSSSISIDATPSLSASRTQESSISHSSNLSVLPPTLSNSRLHGPSSNAPTSNYVNHTFPAPITLPADLLAAGINTNLITNFPIAGDTGSIVSNSTFESLLLPLTVIPHLSRDGGKGGYLDGQHVFIFCDTASFGTTTASEQGEFLGFMSSSVAIDIGMNGLNGTPLTLQDGMGEWGDNVGRLRGFTPMTTGEEAYNLAMSGGGYRYAIWPDSSLIALDTESALLFPVIVYDKVNMATQAANFTTLGNTLLTVRTDDFGPMAERTVNRMFDGDQVQWGSAGGVRSWGPSGVGGRDGRVYLFGKVPKGLLLARITPDAIANQSSYEYWSGTAWTSTMPSPTSTTGLFVNETLMDVDILYSPLQLTFIMVYLSVYADSTFYYRYLLADHAILPSYAGGHDEEYVENIVRYPWSEERVLYKADKPPAGKYIYAGSVHAGYYGEEDITRGGAKMLLSWTANTGEPAASVHSGYAIVTAEVELGI